MAITSISLPTDLKATSPTTAQSLDEWISLGHLIESSNFALVKQIFDQWAAVENFIFSPPVEEKVLNPLELIQKELKAIQDMHYLGSSSFGGTKLATAGESFMGSHAQPLTSNVDPFNDSKGVNPYDITTGIPLIQSLIEQPSPHPITHGRVNLAEKFAASLPLDISLIGLTEGVNHASVDLHFF